MANMGTVRSIPSAAVGFPETAIPEHPREILRAGIVGEQLEFCGWSIRAGCLPLLDRDRRQCVRIAARGSGPPVQVSIRIGDRVVATGARESGRLFVPEVRSPVDATLVLEANGERLVRPLRLEPQRRWSVFVVHHSHLDIGYTDLQGVVLRHHLTYLDQALDFAARTDDWADDARFRWNVESLLPLERWLATRPRAAVDELSARIRAGRFEVCALPFGTHTEALSLDELARLLRSADELRTSRGWPIVTAMQTDVPGAVLGLPAALAGAGIKYLAVAHNYAGRATPYLTGGLELPRLFYWGSPAGERVLVWQTDSPHGVAYLEGNLLGLAESPALAEELVPEYLAALASRAYPYGSECVALGLPSGFERAPYPHDVLHLRVQGLLADNAPPGLAPAEIVRAWNETWAYPHLRLACNAEFFAEAEACVGDRLETFTGDWTDWWADGLGSAARTHGFNRRAQAGVRTGQTLNALADALAGPVEWGADADRAYDAMSLFDEHTWGAAHPGDDDADGRSAGVLQWQTKAALAIEALDAATSLAERGAVRLAAHAPAESVLVFNTASFARTDVVRLFVPAHRDGLAVRDEATGAELPVAVEPGPAGRNRPQGHTLSFLARDVPALGYRRYALVAGSVEGDRVSAETLENEHYRVELDIDGGSIARLLDKELGRDLVDTESPFAFGGYVYDRYAGAISATMRARPGAVLPADDGTAYLERRELGGAANVAERVSTPVEERVTLRLAAPGACALDLTIRLVHGVRRLDLEYRLDKTAVAAKESVYLTFPFALGHPDVLLEVTGGVDRPEARLPGSAAHMQVVRTWAALAGDGVSVALGTLEAALLEAGSVFLPYPPYPPTEELRGGTLAAWLMNNVWDTNFVLTQSGQARFAFAVASGNEEARVLGLRTGAALSRPLVGLLGGARRGAPAPAERSFCTVDHPAVEVVTLAASRRGHDLMAFVHSLADEPVEARVEFPALDVERVWLGTFLEREERDVTGKAIRLRPGAYVSLAVDLRA